MVSTLTCTLAQLGGYRPLPLSWIVCTACIHSMESEGNALRLFPPSWWWIMLGCFQWDLWGFTLYYGCGTMSSFHNEWVDAVQAPYITLWPHAGGYLGSMPLTKGKARKVHHRPPPRHSLSIFTRIWWRGFLIWGILHSLFSLLLLHVLLFPVFLSTHSHYIKLLKSFSH